MKYTFIKTNDHKGWFEFYVNRFNKTGSIQAEWMAMWYLLLGLSEGDIQLTDDIFMPNKSNDQIILEALYEVRDNPKARRNTKGICNAVTNFLAFVDSDVYYTAGCELSEIFKKWPKFSGSYRFPIPGKLIAYSAAIVQRKAWTRSTKYGALRWELLEFTIAELEKKVKPKVAKPVPMRNAANQSQYKQRA